MSVHKKLMAARIALQKTDLKKTGKNTFAGYSYFELADFIPAIQEIFASQGLCGVVSFGAELATLTITDTDDMTTLVVTSPMSSAALKGCHAVQNLGAVESYIRRYLWVTAMEIVEHDSIDSAQPAAEPAYVSYLSNQQVASLQKLAKEKNIDRNKLNAFLTDKSGYIVTQLAECEESLFTAIKTYLESQ